VENQPSTMPNKKNQKIPTKPSPMPISSTTDKSATLNSNVTKLFGSKPDTEVIDLTKAGNQKSVELDKKGTPIAPEEKSPEKNVNVSKPVSTEKDAKPATAQEPKTESPEKTPPPKQEKAEKVPPPLKPVQSEKPPLPPKQEAPAKTPTPPKQEKPEKTPPPKKSEKSEKSPPLKQEAPTKTPTPSEPEKPVGATEKKEAATGEKDSVAKPAVVKEETKIAEPPKLEPLPQPMKAPRSNETEKIVFLKHTELHAPKKHPFGVRDDAEMKALVESVKDNGVNQPALVRPRQEGGYELVCGNRRDYASKQAGYLEMPCIIRNMTDDEAVLAMTDDNLHQRSEILPSEKALSLKMQYEAIKHQGARFKGVASGDVGKRSIEMVGERNGMNSKQVQRYIRLTELVPDMIKAVDEKQLGFTSAVEISFITRKNQNLIAVSIDGNSSPSLAQAQRMRELDVRKQLNGDVIDGILGEMKKEEVRVIITSAELDKYFGKEKTPREMKDQIIKLLDDWNGKEKAHSKPEKKTPDRG